MTRERVHQHLETADQILSEMTERLIHAADGVRQCPLLLEQVRRELAAANSETKSPVQDNRSLKILRQIRTRTARVQILLDSAALIYCGSLYATPSRTGFYTADGRADTAGPQGHLCLKG